MYITLEREKEKRDIKINFNKYILFKLYNIKY